MPIETDSTTTLADDLDLLSDDPIKSDVEVNDNKEDEGLSEPESDEESQIEEEIDQTKVEVEEEKTEVKDEVAPHERPSFKEITTKYPNIFKDFPALRDVYFREGEFSKVFPSINDAKEAQTNSETFTVLRDGILSGKANGLFKSIQEVDPKALGKLAPEILPALWGISQEAHWAAANPLLQNIVRRAYQVGKTSNDENLMASAEHFANFMFGDPKVATGERSVVAEKSAQPKEDSDLSKREQEFENRVHNSFRNDVIESGNKSLEQMVLERGQGNRLKIDPDGVFSKFIKDTLTEKIMIEVNNSMLADKTHMDYINGLWKKAKQAGYTTEWKDRIKSAFLSRAKSLVPSIRSRLVSEVMGTNREVNQQKTEKIEKTSSRRETQNGRASSGGSNHINTSKVDWNKTSDEDIMNDRVTYKK
jgi:hypothetical protein